MAAANRLIVLTGLVALVAAAALPPAVAAGPGGGDLPAADWAAAAVHYRLLLEEALLPLKRALLQSVQGPLVLEPLPYSDDALQPVISAKVGRGTLPSDKEESIRNNGGGHWNHQLFWRVMSPPGSANTSRDNISPQLEAAIVGAFGSVDQMLSSLKAAGDSRFGSGWSWVCAAGDGGLRVLSTPNQDNPLMAVVRPQPCVPIVGLDVWEHAYYLQYGPKRGDYTSAWLELVNWKQVSANYDAARRGDLAAIAGAV
ncbi:hypothetical protein GPECTOR_14g100 [Gonium pectorale]|uniref:superoxide dismutase n=1 Tax=Gonium pectorale TaxID=33097 RepID=A0A150GM45_GONPE|nr:hypothetical protein GPECTOR_14g100 [Gonium pectorale]|eukprot:KXZ50848.1 hypothetical protein GPECTOR_14g100 [Gonium pectorale]